VAEAIHGEIIFSAVHILPAIKVIETDVVLIVVCCLVSISCSSSATWKDSDFSLGAQAMTFQLNFLVFNFVNHYTTCRSPTDWDIIFMIRESKLNINVGAGPIDPCLGCEACWCEARTCYFLRN
jgi:hypothetical protein